MSETKQPTNHEIYEWIRSQGYEQSYSAWNYKNTLYLEDMPRILREYFE